MKNLIYLVMGGIAIFLVQACHNKQGKNYNETTLVDTQGLNFITNGIEGSLTEIKASGLVITNSSNQRVIGFAKTMIGDHTQALDELKKIETDKLVIEKDTINGDHQKMISGLSKKLGHSFDKAYMQMMVKDHEEAVKLFASASTNNEPAIQNFAKNKLPIIQMHLDSAIAIFASLK